MAVPSTGLPDAPRAGLVRAVVAKAPASPSDTLLVRVQAAGNALSEVVSWPLVTPLPAVGDGALVSYDERGEPWLVAWERASSEPVLSTLPSEPYDGQTITFQSVAMAAVIALWRFRYRAASPSIYKWEFVGGSPMLVSGATDEQFTLGSAAFVYQDLPTSPKLEVPLAGNYAVGFGLNIIQQNNEANRELDVRLFTTANVGVGDFVRDYRGLAAVAWENSAYREDAVELAASATLKLRAAGNTTAVNGYRTNARFIRAMPLRVG